MRRGESLHILRQSDTQRGPETQGADKGKRRGPLPTLHSSAGPQQSAGGLKKACGRKRRLIRKWENRITEQCSSSMSYQLFDMDILKRCIHLKTESTYYILYVTREN